MGGQWGQHPAPAASRPGIRVSQAIAGAGGQPMTIRRQRDAVGGEFHRVWPAMVASGRPPLGGAAGK